MVCCVDLALYQVSATDVQSEDYSFVYQDFHHLDHHCSQLIVVSNKLCVFKWSPSGGHVLPSFVS